MLRTVVLLACGLLCGCSRYYKVDFGPNNQDPHHHYVLVQASGEGGGERVYDCRSVPDGQKWDPTCVKVKFVNAPK